MNDKMGFFLEAGMGLIVSSGIFLYDQFNYWPQILLPLEMFYAFTPLSWPHGMLSKVYQFLTLHLAL